MMSSRFKFVLLFAAAIPLINNSTVRAASPILFDFNNGVNFQPNFPASPQPNVWYTVKDGCNTTLDTLTTGGSPALKYIDIDNGSSNSKDNGVYIIVPNAIPANSTYRLRCTFSVNETTTGGNIEPFSYFILGYKINGSHRGQGQTLPNATTYGGASDSYLTNFNDNNKTPITIETPPFTASAGDSLQIILSSSFRYTNYRAATMQPDEYAMIDDIQLLDTLPVTVSGWTLE